MRPILIVAALAAATASLPPIVSGQATERDTLPIFTLEPLRVQGRMGDLSGLASSASTGFVGAADLRVRPIAREGELLEVVPGMILSQHSGSGKANQQFVRGFNLDHGTDFSTRLEGMPINLPTHAHGQGYTDLNFLIPEVVESIEYSLGNYYADIGDFGSAGGAHIRLVRNLERPRFELGLGANGHRRIVAVAAQEMGARGSFLAGAELRGYDGPWEIPEETRKLSGLMRYTFHGRTHTLSVLALGYDNEWRASDQIPTRAVASGLISRFGQIDPTLGGASSRYSLSGNWTRSTSAGSQHADVYAIRYGMDLFSNFTYLLDDPSQGDQIRQVDDGRWTVGANLGHQQPVDFMGRDGRVAVGLQLRSDAADLRLARTRARDPIGVVRADVVRQTSVGAHAEWTSHWSDSFRTVAGLRGDLFGFDVSSDLAPNSGSVVDGIVSPKLSLAWMPRPGAEVYVSGGLGFHSNDARGTTASVDPVTSGAVDPVDPLVASRGAEVGGRLSTFSGLVSTVAVWTVDLDSELVYVGDAGRVEASDPSRRVGVTFTNFYRFAEEWMADADVSFTRARFRSVAEGLDRIPGAVENVVAAGLAYEPRADGVFAAVRLRHMGSYPLIEDGSRSADASSLVNLRVGVSIGGARLTAHVLNVFDERDSDIQYFYASRLPGEVPAGIEDVHFHPSEPRQLRFSLSWGL
ncbi:MAG: TonB-dependent receptor [Gemmatimonadetes bacterium]|nr:TonB-dependent receptor [Gemmatimonadota bacterium]